jgi:trk system potassium uptake protein TrkA
MVSAAMILDILNAENLQKILPKSIDAVVIDMGAKIEASILATSYCHKMGIKTIIVKAETEAHGEILELVGATKVVFPNKEAAKRIVPMLFSSIVLNYLPLSGKLVIAEVEVPEDFIGHTVLELDLRKRYGLNLISVRNEETEYEFFSTNYKFQPGDIILVSCNERDLELFTGRIENEERRKAAVKNLTQLFSFRKNKNRQ